MVRECVSALEDYATSPWRLGVWVIWVMYIYILIQILLALTVHSSIQCDFDSRIIRVMWVIYVCIYKYLPALKVLASIQRHLDALRNVHGGKLIWQNFSKVSFTVCSHSKSRRSWLLRIITVTEVAVVKHAHVGITRTFPVSEGRPLTQSQLMKFLTSQLHNPFSQ